MSDEETSVFIELDCNGQPVMIEVTEDRNVFFHSWDRESEEAAKALGFEPSDCMIILRALKQKRASDRAYYLDQALLEAVKKGNVAFTHALLAVGANPDIPTEGVSVTGFVEPLSPLSFAVTAGNAPLVDLLLDYGAEIDQHDSAENATPLFIFAMGTERPDILELLLGNYQGDGYEIGRAIYSAGINFEQNQRATDRLTQQFVALLLEHATDDSDHFHVGDALGDLYNEGKKRGYRMIKEMIPWLEDES